MRKLKNVFFYIVIIGGFSLLMYWIVLQGTKLETAKNILTEESIAQESITSNLKQSQWSEFLNGVSGNLEHPLATLLLQIIVIIVVARIFGWLFKKIGQPAVIGEIIAGIVLGPSLIGAIFPEFYHALFPESSFNNLKILSEIGLILFMYVVGMELDLKILKTKAHEAVVISHASIILPFALGMGLAYFIYTAYAPAGVQFSSFGLFMGISMSITAFPVLARIVQERGMNKTKLGTVIITCAAVDDITAWCLLAVVIAIVKAGTFVSALYTILFAVVYVLVMIKVVKPFLHRIAEVYSSREKINKSIVAIFFLTLLLSSFCTETIGIHALFGAFMAGAIMPSKVNFRNMFVEKVEDIALVLFLPLFFVYTGLRTEIGLINEPELWMVTGWIVLVAVVGKFFGSSLAGKFVGQTWKESLMVGALMNTRGLMELVVINIGYDLGVLTEEVFAMMVIMALVTTFMTSPSLYFINKLFPDKEREKDLIRQHAEGVFKALIALGDRKSGRSMVNVAKTVLDGTKNSLEVTVLHMTEGTDTNPLHGDKFSVDNFIEAEEEAKSLNIPIQKLYKVTDRIQSHIVQIINEENFDFLLVGAGISLAEKPLFEDSKLFKRIPRLNTLLNKIAKHRTFFYPRNLIKDKTRYFIENSNCSVGVFVNRNFSGISNTLIVIRNEEDEFLLRYGRRIIMNNPAIVIDIYDINKLAVREGIIADGIADLKKLFPGKINMIKNSRSHAQIYHKHSFMLISYPTWTEMTAQDKTELTKIPSTLIINKKSSRFTTGRYK